MRMALRSTSAAPVSRPTTPTRKASTSPCDWNASAATGSWIWTNACQKVEEWRTEYNEVRPHNAIGDRTPLPLIHMPRQQTEALNGPEILS